jgi:hypothetical protein
MGSPLVGARDVAASTKRDGEEEACYIIVRA